MEYKHTTPKFVELIRRQAESAYEENEPVKLSPVALLAYIEEFEEMSARIAELEAELKTRNARILPPMVRPDFFIDDDDE